MKRRWIRFRRFPMLFQLSGKSRQTDHFPKIYLRLTGVKVNCYTPWVSINEFSAQTALPPIVPGSQEDSLVKGLQTMDISRISDHVQLLDWWAQIEQQMCANVADEKSRQMIESLSIEKDYSQRYSISIYYIYLWNSTYFSLLFFI